MEVVGLFSIKEQQGFHAPQRYCYCDDCLLDYIDEQITDLCWKCVDSKVEQPYPWGCDDLGLCLRCLGLLVENARTQLGNP